MNSSPWTPGDLNQMKALGISPEEAGRQLWLFKNPPPFARLVRPALVGDGILRLNPREKKAALRGFQAASRRGRFAKFVPASGAASRMFHLLTQFLQREPFTTEDLRREVIQGREDSRRFLEFMEALSRTAFFDELGEVLARKQLDLESLRRDGRFKEILEALLLPGGLNYAQKPKGLIKFHAYQTQDRTPLEEHLVEAVETVRDKARRCRIHFTVSEEHEKPCRGHFMAVREGYEKRYGVKFDIRFSTQRTSTQTVAVDKENRPLRDRLGKLVFRPSGHGALLENLAGLKGDLVYIKNIDNVSVEGRAKNSVYWKKVLGGFMIAAQSKIFRVMGGLAKERVSSDFISRAAALARGELNLDLGKGFDRLPEGQKIKALRAALDRPLRVCGVVRNTGEPGGGPFWVRGGDEKTTLQIVESAQIDLDSKPQREIFQGSTHFNPVDLVCGLRNWKGKPFDLNRFRDPDAVFISRKTANGREIKALELPGLWNGAMAHWITLLVEVPLETFNPVKTIFDLLKPAHQEKGRPVPKGKRG